MAEKSRRAPEAQNPAPSSSGNYRDPSTDLGMRSDVGAATGPIGAEGEAKQYADIHFNRQNKLDVPEVSAEEILVTLSQTPKGPLPMEVTQRRGSIESPVIEQLASPTSIFAGGGPQVSDVTQGTLGDCFFLSTVAGVLSRDPGHLQSMISDDGTTMTVQFWRYDASSSQWVPAPVSVNHQLFVRSNNGETQVEGVRLQASDEVDRSLWFAEQKSETLSIIRAEERNFALWMPLFEKAYASYIQQYGMYGGFTGTPSTAEGEDRSVDQQNPEPGYAALTSGGDPNGVYGVFFGPALEDSYKLMTAAGGGSELITNNRAIIERLLAFQGPSSEMVMTASTGTGAEVFDQLMPMLVDTALELQTVSESAARSLATHVRTLKEMSKENRPLLGPEIVQTILADGGFRQSSRAADLEALLLQAKAITGEGNPDQLSVSPNHAYTLLGASMKGADGQALSGPIDTILADISAENSTVRLRNPMGRQEPDAEGDGPTDGANDGSFDMSLHRFLNDFSQLHVAELQ